MTTEYLPTIGIECHVQLSTKTKLFSEVDNDARQKEPNSCVSPVDYGLPGMLPRLNHTAILYTIRAGLALNAKINLNSRFDRKHYYYPDLPKGYQITQMYSPIIGAGSVELPDGTIIPIEHAHLEEDAGKLSHYRDYSLVDLNRAGTPLIEIVSEPAIHSAAAARDYAKELWRLMTYAGVTYGDLYNGNMRFDVNISLAPKGSKELGTRAEVKNLNSFRSVERVIEYEIKRQTRILQQGGQVVQETRGWNDATGETTDQRSKESAADYRYMPEPDLPPLRLTPELVEAERRQLSPLPAWYRERLTPVIGSDLTEILLDHQPLVAKLAELDDPQAIKLIANLFSSVLLAEENASLLNDELPSKTQLADLVTMRNQNELSSTATKEVFLKYFDPEMHYKDTRTIAKELGVIQENDTAALEALVDQVLAQPTTAQAQTDYRNGQTKVLGFLVGQVMKASHGQANPTAVQEILRQKLA